MAFHPLILATLLAANSLQHLTVTQLTLSSDTATPRIETPFDLIVTAHVRESVTSLENVDLPLIEKDLELLGDQRSVVTDRSGTTYTETIRVIAHHTGTIAVDPVTLDAIDARDGKPKRYSSNNLTLNIGGAALAMQMQTVDWFGMLLGSARWLVPIVALILALGLLMRRRKSVPASPPSVPRPIELPRAMPTRESRLRDALTTLRVDRTRATAMRIRHAVREMVGADDAETLADVLAKAKGDEALRALLRALERAGFTYDADLQPAIDAVLSQLERMTA